jgi:hypothetical protein
MICMIGYCPAVAPGAETCGRRLRRRIANIVIFAIFVGIGLSARPAAALPLYARQTGEPCATCHTAFFELTPFGRRFKLGAYNLGGGDWKGPPFAVALQPGFTHLQAPQAGGLAPGFADNNAAAMQQMSLFTGGKIADHLGAFIQGTYDGVFHQFHWDNTDVRYAREVKFDNGHTMLWGIDLNNSPTVQDVWNTTPAWAFPYISSELTPTPTATPIINQVYAQQVLGLSTYAFVDDMLYFEFGGYRPLSDQTQKALGIDPPAQNPISGIAPYWRIAVEKNIGNHSLEIGTFGLAGQVFPMGLSQAGMDSFTDVGFDAQYQFLGDPNMVTARVARIYQSEDTRASQLLGLASNSRDTLQFLNASVSYIYKQTWSLTGGWMATSGTADAALYGTPTGGPNSAGWIAELAYLPFMHGGPKFWPWLNFRIGLQYMHWSKFDGASTNIDGMGRTAQDNNTLFLYVWTAF